MFLDKSLKKTVTDNKWMERMPMTKKKLMGLKKNAYYLAYEK
jgi:hypothetical protein